MPDYRRYWVPGGTYFFTLVTHERRHLFAEPANVASLRRAIAVVQAEQVFDFCAAVVLPDHMHFLWTLPAGDCDYARRIGRLKVLFTRSFRQNLSSKNSASASRRQHRESEVWQRRYWEHTIKDDAEIKSILDYIHYNPVKHGWATCPHVWPASSFRRWAARGLYELQWGCCCDGRRNNVMLPKIDCIVGEP